MDWHQVWVVEKYVRLEGMCVVGGYVWLRCVVDGCGQLDGCGWFWNECGFGWCVVGGVWVVDGCGWLWGVVVVESVWLEGYGWSQGCNQLKVWVVEGDYVQINT